MKKIKLYLLTPILLLSLVACSRQPQLDGAHYLTIEPRTYANTLFYSGTVQPLKTLVIPSPAEGAVVEMPFQYGESVKTGQLLFMISSTKFLTDYKSALTAYVKAKSQFNNAQTQLSEGEFLHKNLLISDDEFKSRQSNFYTAQLELVQAKDALQQLISQLDVKDVNLYNLSISDVDKITKALHLQPNSETLRVLAPGAGVVLAPSKNEDETKKIMKGDVVKQGDTLAVIGDLTGLSVRFKVNELTVNQLKVGQKITITGIAFPNDILKGQISRVDRQGESSGGGMPTFFVEVIVPTLTQQQQREIHVGMSAKVEIDIDEAPQIMIPITALIEKNGTSFVKLYDEQKGDLRAIEVKTGKTTLDSVVILSGLKKGDKIVVPN